MSQVNPFTNIQKDQIDNAISSAKEARTNIKRAEMAGIDVEELKVVNETNLERLEKMKAAFFPNG